MEIPDADAVQNALTDPEQFSVLIERYEGRLLKYIYRLGISDLDIAKDILQEAFIKTYLNLNDYNSSLTFSSWVYRITRNEVLMHFRHMKNRPHAVIGEDLSALFENIPDELDIVHESDMRLKSIHVAKALQLLKPLYREVIVLRFFDEKTYDEISDILQVPKGTIATHIARGKVALQKILQEMNIKDV